MHCLLLLVYSVFVRGLGCEHLPGVALLAHVRPHVILDSGLAPRVAGVPVHAIVRRGVVLLRAWLGVVFVVV